MNSQHSFEKGADIGSLQEAIDFIAEKFVFDEASYPLLQKLSPKKSCSFL